MEKEIKVEQERFDDEVDAYGVYEKITSADKCTECVTRKEICFTEKAAEFSLKLSCAYYDAYDSGYSREIIKNGRCYTKDGVEVKLYFKKITLIVQD